MPFRDVTGSHERVASLGFVTAWYGRHFPAWRLLPPDDGEPEFHRVKAINRAIDAQPEDAVIVWADPASFLRWPGQLRRAVRLAEEPGVVLPHQRVMYLNPDASRRVLDHWSFEFTDEECDEVVPSSFGNLLVFSRATWLAAGGLDERFPPLYGGDDAAFGYACDALVAPVRRLEGDAIHLWHPRLAASVPGTREYGEQFAILAEYRDASERGSAAVRELVASR